MQTSFLLLLHYTVSFVSVSSCLTVNAHMQPVRKSRHTWCSQWLA